MAEADDRRRALHDEFLEAVNFGDAAKVQRMLADKNLDPNYADPRDGFTALHLAAARNAVAVLKLLIASGRCDLAARDRNGRTAATIATVIADNPAVGRYLLDLQYGDPPPERPPVRRGVQRREEG